MNDNQLTASTHYSQIVSRNQVHKARLGETSSTVRLPDCGAAEVCLISIPFLFYYSTSAPSDFALIYY